MGTAKDNLTPKSDGAKSLFAGVRSKFGNRRKASDIENFAESITDAETSLRVMIAAKENDLRNEKGKEAQNTEKLVTLRTMMNLLEMIAYNADQYVNPDGN